MIYVFIADGFEEIEALTVVDILRRAELTVQMVGVSSKTVRGAHGISVLCDILDSQTDLADIEMIVLPGGMPGTLNLEKSPVVQAFIQYAVERGLPIGAICAAPSILGHLGLLDHKTITCYPGFESQMPLANYTGSACEQDGNIITGSGAGTAMEFALKLVEHLKGKERAELLRAAVGYQ
ncbi:DJ-1 family glyoxalase III [Hydrogenoanaerobacterium sp.]|uniref:DJ-1 family glyoxalase III n=1 Tax=Hydrogenoanaerobacterium sp. TaxID=2953763 RepID=UPI0028983742|nr:DJ-1 family glyoxalase III [Hydrogenoanaerobacterium sp.]